jgi:hypothetical protein
MIERFHINQPQNLFYPVSQLAISFAGLWIAGRMVMRQHDSCSIETKR